MQGKVKGNTSRFCKQIAWFFLISFIGQSISNGAVQMFLGRTMQNCINMIPHLFPIIFFNYLLVVTLLTGQHLCCFAQIVG
jgi:hypothetical protein